MCDLDDSAHLLELPSFQGLDRFLDELAEITSPSDLSEGFALIDTPVVPDLPGTCLPPPNLLHQSQSDLCSASTQQPDQQQRHVLGRQPSRRSAAWTAKNRRGQQKFRDKQKVSHYRGRWRFL